MPPETPDHHGDGDEDGDADDRALLAAHVAGDAEAFGTLFTRHRDRLWAVALRTTGSPEEAADALQDAMVSAFRRAGTYRGEARVTTWLHRIVVNACLDRIRRARVRAADPLPDDLETRATTDDGPEQSLERREVRDRLLAALATLAPDQRAALVLVDVQGYAVDEAAAVLECPVGTVKSRCSRGRARLARILSAPPDGTDLRPGSSDPEEVS